MGRKLCGRSKREPQRIPLFAPEVRGGHRQGTFESRLTFSPPIASKTFSSCTRSCCMLFIKMHAYNTEIQVSDKDEPVFRCKQLQRQHWKQQQFKLLRVRSTESQGLSSERSLWAGVWMMPLGRVPLTPCPLTCTETQRTTHPVSYRPENRLGWRAVRLTVLCLDT